MLMKCLSVRQPWAWLIVNGFKDIENREWQHNNPCLRIRGPVLIHASKSSTPDDQQRAWDMISCQPVTVRSAIAAKLSPNGLAYTGERGGIVGIATFGEPTRQSQSTWFQGDCWGLPLTDARPLKFYPCMGRLGFFVVDYPHDLGLT